MTQEMYFEVFGEPKPKGSMRAFPIRGSKRIVMTNSNPNTKEWQQRIATEAQKTTSGLRGWPTENAVEVRLDFFMPRPKSLPKRIRLHVKRPDIDKLARATLDGMTGIIFKDDSQVVELIATKQYAFEAPPKLQVTVYAIDKEGD